MNENDMDEKRMEQMIKSAEDAIHGVFDPKAEKIPDIAESLWEKLPSDLREGVEFETVKDELRILGNASVALHTLGRTASITDVLGHIYGRPRWLIGLRKYGYYFSDYSENGGELNWAKGVLKDAGKALRTLKNALGKENVFYRVWLCVIVGAAIKFVSAYSRRWDAWRPEDKFTAYQIEDRHRALSVLEMTEKIAAETTCGSEEILFERSRILEGIARLSGK